MLDMSAAIDLVDYGLLAKKLDVYGFEKASVKWVISYLSQRSQQVYIDGVLSDPLDIDVGVPQGSILGPLLYIIYTNDLPEAVHDHLNFNCTFLNTDCRECGGVCCYADDSTYSISGKDPIVLKDVLASKYKVMASYMSNNILV